MLPSAVRPLKNSSVKNLEFRNGKENRKVTLVKSPIGCKKAHRQTVLGLGLKKIRQTRELEDTPAVRGMINTVSYLVRAE